MARRATASLLAATMFGTIDSNALVPIIALYAQAIGADLVQTGIIVGLFSLVHAPPNLFFGRTRRRFPDCGDGPGADPSSTEDDAVATPAHVRGPTRSGRRVRIDLQSLLHPRRLRCARSPPSPTGTRIRTPGGGPELHGVCDFVVALALSRRHPGRPIRPVDTRGNRPRRGGPRHGEHPTGPGPARSHRPDGSLRRRARLRVSGRVDARFSRRRPGTARPRDGLVLRRPRLRGRGRRARHGRRRERHDLRRWDLGECLGLARRPGVSGPRSHLDRDALGRRGLDEIDQWSEVGRELALFQMIARENTRDRSYASCLTAKPLMHHRRVLMWLWRLVAAG